MHEADQPDLVIDLSDTHHLAGEHDTEVDFALTEADAATASDPYGFVVIRVLGLCGWLVGPRRRCIDVAGISATERLVGSLIVVNPDEVIEAFLLLQEIERGGLGGFFFQG